MFKTYAEALAAWNTRPSSPEADRLSKTHSEALGELESIIVQLRDRAVNAETAFLGASGSRDAWKRYAKALSALVMRGPVSLEITFEVKQAEVALHQAGEQL